MLKKITNYYKNHPWLQVVILFIAWRLMLQIIVWWAGVRFPDASYPYQTSVSGNPWLASWAKWDSVYYHDFIANGYKVGPFFPLFSWLVGIINWVISNHQLLAAAIIVNSAALGSCIMLYKLARLEENENFALRAVFFLLIFPSSFFLVAHYTESLFMLIVLLAFYYANKKSWWLTGIFGFLACFIRTTGILIFPALLVYLVLDNWHQIRSKINWKSLIPLSLIPLGLISFMIYGWLRFGEPIAFIKNQTAFGRHFEPNVLLTVKKQCLRNLIYPDKFFTEDATNAFNYLFFFSIFLIFIILLFRYSSPSYAVLGFLFFIIPATSGTFISMNRFLLVLFPIYLLLAKLVPPNSLVEKIYILISFSLSILMTILFTNDYWVG